MLLQQSTAILYLLKITKTLWPSGHIVGLLGKYRIYYPYHPLCPLVLHSWFHHIHLHSLHQAMDTEHSVISKTLHQREFEQFRNHLLKREEVSSSFLEQGRPIDRPISEQLLWDAVRCQKGA